MKVGVFMLVTESSADPAAVAKRAEELGFDSFWVPEHPLIPVKYTSRYPGSADGSLPAAASRIADPFVALARASAVTQTIKLGTGICLVPEHNPLVLAKTIATLDHISNGRVLFGIGAGWLKEETEILGGNFPHRWSQTREAVLAMKELWTKDEAEFHGKFYDFPPVRSSPKPAQKPHPPVLLGGAAANVFKRAAAWGDGWLPIRVTPEDVKKGRAILDELAQAQGRAPNSLEITVYGQEGDPDMLKRFEEAGASRVTVRMPAAGGDAAFAALERMAERLFA